MMFTNLLKFFGVPSGRGEEQLPQPVNLGRVVSDASRCVQCGMCGYNCPVGIPVRDYARQGLIVDDPGCITCGQCINICPRGTLRWESETHDLVATFFATPQGPLLEENGDER